MPPYAALVVEDDPFLLLNAMDIVGDAGFHAYGARTADGAIELLEQHDDIKMLFVDTDISGTMDGLKLAHAVRGRWPPVTIIVVTVDPRLSLKDLPNRALLIPKPYFGTTVVAALRRVSLALEPQPYRAG